MEQKMMTRKIKKLSSTIKVWHLACAGVMFGQMVSPTAMAGPKGGVVTGGEGDISVDGLTTTITQKTDLLAIDWESFNISEEMVSLSAANEPAFEAVTPRSRVA